MIGLIASILAAITLGNPVFLLTAPIYALRLKDRNAALIGFYAYTIILTTTLPNTSIYESPGLKMAIIASLSTILTLDEILRGPKLNKETLTTSGILTATALNDYTLMLTLTGTTLYTTYKNFGKATTYFTGWLTGSATLLYLTKDKLPDPAAQALVIIGLGLAFLLIAERKEVKLLEVNLREKN